MELSESADMADPVVQQYMESYTWSLSPGDGPKQVYARFQDVAGNTGSISSASITLDTTPPLSGLAPPPSLVTQLNFSVSWSAQDNVSGVDWFDVEYRDGNGPWTPWLSRTNSTSAVFRGQDGRSYYFRVRARDLAGNLEPFGTSAGPVLVELLPPVVTITEPFANATVSGRLTIRGTAYHADLNRSVLRVMVRLDDGDWELASGTSSWLFELNTRGLRNGPHIIRAKALDGLKESAVVERVFIVSNRKPEPSVTVEGGLPLLLLLVIILACAGICLAYWSGRRRRERAA